MILGIQNQGVLNQVRPFCLTRDPRSTRDMRHDVTTTVILVSLLPRRHKYTRQTIMKTISYVRLVILQTPGISSQSTDESA